MAYQFSYTPAVEADRRLLPFQSYNDYLDSLVKTVDLRNLRSIPSSRTVASLGYRSTGETLTEDEFYRRRQVMQEIVRPISKRLLVVSKGSYSKDPLVQELALREQANRTNQLQTIIYVRTTSKDGYQISAYVDYAERVMTENWKPFFHDGKQLCPKVTDLSYYHRKNTVIYTNDSKNFLPTMDNAKGLLFMNRHDRMTICVDPNSPPGINTTRYRIRSDNYAQVEIYDHVANRKT